MDKVHEDRTIINYHPISIFDYSNMGKITHG